MYFTKPEKDAFKAGVRKGEANVSSQQNAVESVLRESIGALWALLGADSQTQAVKRINELMAALNDGGDIRRANEHMIEALHERQAIITALQNSLASEREKFQDIIKAQRESFNADFNALSDSKTNVQAALHNSEHECNRLSMELTAAKKMGAHYLKTAKGDIDGAQFLRGSPVVKKDGYGFPGEVVAVFRNKIGQIRYVVEATGAGYEGTLHIFNGDQLAQVATKAMAFGNVENFGSGDPFTRQRSTLEIETKKFVETIGKLFRE